MTDYYNEVRMAVALERIAVSLEKIENKLNGEKSSSEWCPVCHSYHEHPGVRTDAGKIITDCGRAIKA